jgi:hypothetical protein
MTQSPDYKDTGMNQEPVICEVCKRSFKDFQWLKIHLNVATWWKYDAAMVAAHARLLAQYRGWNTQPRRGFEELLAS